jgi:hypothetical protein
MRLQVVQGGAMLAFAAMLIVEDEEALDPLPELGLHATSPPHVVTEEAEMRCTSSRISPNAIVA